MSRLPFPAWAALSLALHLGLVLGTEALVSHREARERAASGASDSRAPGTSAALGGETFDVAEETPDLESLPPDVPATPPASTPAPADLEVDAPLEEPAKAQVGARPSKRSNAPHATDPGAAAAPPPPPALYGAVGDRAASDLVTAFKKQFATGASSDPIWNEVPVGFYAAGSVTFFLSPEGRLLHTTLSADAAPAFRAAVARTVALIRGRSFTARGEQTHLRIVVRVSGELVNHGAFTVNAEGSFELPSGRHVSVRVDER